MKIGFPCLPLALAALLQVSVLASPFESTVWTIPENEVDRQVGASLEAVGLRRALASSDATFVRRVYLDLCGTLPDRQAVEAFLRDRLPDKRIRLIDTLIGSDDYVEFFTLRWCDLLRVKSEYPVNLWPNAVQAYHRWIRDAVAENRPYDRFARELLTASGSNFRLPASNFYRVAPSTEARDLAEVVSFTFMGLPLEALGETGSAGLAGFFELLGFKRTQEWKEEIVFWSGSVSEEVEYRFPDGERLRLPQWQDPRDDLAQWLVGEANPWFARSLVNRVWYWVNGYGLYEDADDISSACRNQGLVDYLAKELEESGYDVPHLLRLILSSRTYQQSCVPLDAASASPFCSYQLRPLEAEVMADALTSLLGIQFHYSSPIPEPFTFIPRDQRTISLADGSITSAFLEAFGRPSRDSGRLSERSTEPTASQRLYLLNSEDMHSQLNRKSLSRLAGESRSSPEDWIEGIYLSILSRKPSLAESRKLKALAQRQGGKGSGLLVDLAWALINSKEFQFKH